MVTDSSPHASLINHWSRRVFYDGGSEKAEFHCENESSGMKLFRLRANVPRLKEEWSEEGRAAAPWLKHRVMEQPSHQFRENKKTLKQAERMTSVPSTLFSNFLGAPRPQTWSAGRPPSSAGRPGEMWRTGRPRPSGNATHRLRRRDTAILCIYSDIKQWPTERRREREQPRAEHVRRPPHWSGF